jgi:hypothetical protein
MKNRAFQYGERLLVPKMNPQPVRAPGTFSGYCAQKQIAVLRAAAGVPSYLNDVTLRRLLARRTRR